MYTYLAITYIRGKTVKITLLLTLSNYNHGLKKIIVYNTDTNDNTYTYIILLSINALHTHIILLLALQLVPLPAASFVVRTEQLGRGWASLQLAWGTWGTTWGKGTKPRGLEWREGSRQLLQNLVACTNREWSR